MSQAQNLVILGSTGSVGVSTLDVVRLHPDQFSISCLTAATNVEKMLEQCTEFHPESVIMSDAAAAQLLAEQLKAKGLTQINVQHGEQAFKEVVQAKDVDAVMAAIVGAAGLLPTLYAVQAGKRVLIANKEPLVMTGELFMSEACRCGATILPIDSEHNAIFQCLPDDQNLSGVQKLHLTASGGPFRGKQWASLTDITPDQACAHPNWSMGRKISVDSATMMNKGLELIEASALFNISAERVNIIIHPQSIIHSLVEYRDGSFLAQLGAPDMKIPIAHALSWPDRIESNAASLDLTEIAQLDFQKPDMGNLPCLALAKSAALTGGSAPAVLNAANEVAVESFLNQQIRFTDIPRVIEAALELADLSINVSIDNVLTIDNEARNHAMAAVNSLQN